MSATTSLYMRLKGFANGAIDLLSALFLPIIALLVSTGILKGDFYSSHRKSLGAGRFEYLCNSKCHERCVLLLYTGVLGLYGGEAV